MILNPYFEKANSITNQISEKLKDSLFGHTETEFSQIKPMLEEVIYQYGLAIQLDPKSDESYFGRGQCRILLKIDIETILKDFRKAFELNPNNPKYSTRLGELSLYEKRFKEAIQYFDIRISLGNPPRWTFPNRAEAKREIEDFKGAITDYTTAIDIFMDDCPIDLYYWRGYCYKKLGFIEESKSDYAIFMLHKDAFLYKDFVNYLD